MYIKKKIINIKSDEMHALIVLSVEEDARVNVAKLYYREVWPENDSFGRADIPPEEEFLALREIFFADLGGE